MIRQLRYYLPLVIFLLLALFLWRGLKLDPHKLPSTLLNKPAPEFQLIDIQNIGRFFSKQQLLGKVSLVNVWATWCTACQQEHAVLLDIANTQRVAIYGLDYKDDMQTAKKWLSQYGNPYQAVGFDGTGQVAIDWGVYGTPETFLVDQQGVIQYKHIGALTHEVWEKEFLPLIDKLQQV